MTLRRIYKEITSVDRCKQCGDALGSAIAVKLKIDVAHFTGVEFCARIWLCPVCMAKIRARRGDEVAYGAGKHIAGGGYAYFVTATLPHEQGDALKVTLGLLADCWRAIMSGKAAKTDKDRFGIVGYIKAVEITHGQNGWNPHIHAVFLVEKEITFLEYLAWVQRMKGRWDYQLVKRGWRPTHEVHGFRVDQVKTTTIKDLAAYVTKVQDGGGLGNEMTRVDLKTGLRGSRTFTQIIWDYHQTGNVADLVLIGEYEEAVEGRSAIRWSPGLRGQLLAKDEVDVTDTEIAAEDIGGEEVVVLMRHTYQLIQQRGAESNVLDAIENGGFDALIRTLLALGIPTEGVYTPDEYRALGIDSEG